MRGLSVDAKGRLRVPEACLEQAIVDILSLDNWSVFRTGWALTKAGRELGAVGMPDLLALRYGPDGGMAEVAWVEAKAEKRKPTTEQKLWHIAERRRGAMVWVAGEDFPATVEGFLAHYRASGFEIRG